MIYMCYSNSCMEENGEAVEVVSISDIKRLINKYMNLNIIIL